VAAARRGSMHAGVSSDAQHVHAEKNYDGKATYQVLRPYPAAAFNGIITSLEDIQRSRSREIVTRSAPIGRRPQTLECALP
jgi:hypothetical protein